MELNTNTQYVRRKENAKKYRGKIITLSESYQMTAESLTAHFENGRLRSSFVHEIGDRTAKRYRLRGRV